MVVLPSARTLVAFKPMAGILRSNVGTVVLPEVTMPRKVAVPLLPAFAAVTAVGVVFTAGPRSPNTVPTGGRLFVKLNAGDPTITTLAGSGDPMDTVGVVVVVLFELVVLLDVVLPDVVLFDVVLPDVVLFDVVLFDVVLPDVVLLLGAVVPRDVPPPPPPPEHAVRATRHTDDVRRKAPFQTVSIPSPKFVILVQGHGKLGYAHTHA